MDYPDVAEVRAKAREDWEREQSKRIPLQEKIGKSVPWWLVIVAVVFFTLSVPHTAATFEIITPSVGYIAPLGVEFGLLYTAFRKRQLRSTDKKAEIPTTIVILEVLLFVVAIVVNGVGTLQAVADEADFDNKSAQRIVESFDEMKAENQVALILVPMAALIIPIGTMVAGEGLAALFLENRERRQDFDLQWKLVRAEVEYEALRDAALGRGISPRDAIRWASQIVGLSVRPQRTVRTTTDGQEDVRMDADGQTAGQVRTTDARERVREYLREHPESAQYPVREIAKLAGIGKSVAAEEKAKFNGH